MVNNDIVITCHNNPEFPDRNFALAKDWGEIIYCIEVGCERQEYCEHKKIIQNWK